MKQGLPVESSELQDGDVSPEMRVLSEIYLLVLHLETCGTDDHKKILELEQQIEKLKPQTFSASSRKDSSV